MAVALKNRPVLNWTPPPGVTMAQWDSGSGMVTDAFKPDQVPGGSRAIGSALVSDTATTPGGPTSSGADQSSSTPGGVDSGLGGLY
jgi:hypothetical protein